MAPAARRAAGALASALHPTLTRATPPVPSGAAPTAAAWLRARGSLPHSLAASLFRRRAVRLVDAHGRTRRVAAGATLPPGAALAVPASVGAAAATPPSPPLPSRPLSPASAALAAALPGRVLAAAPDFFIVAKAAGEHAQGGARGAPPTLDAAAAAAWPEARLVHRCVVRGREDREGRGGKESEDEGDRSPLPSPPTPLSVSHVAWTPASPAPCASRATRPGRPG